MPFQLTIIMLNSHRHNSPCNSVAPENSKKTP